MWLGECAGGTPSRCAGRVTAACTQGTRAQQGKLLGVVRNDQADACERCFACHSVRFADAHRSSRPTACLWRNAGSSSTPFKCLKSLLLLPLKAFMNIDLPFIPDEVLIELAALITTWEAIRKAKGMGPITENSIELHQEVVKLLAAFDVSLAQSSLSSSHPPSISSPAR